MKGFIVYTTHALIDGKTYVQLFGRLENGESFVSQHSVRPYLFIKESDQKKAGPLLSKYTVEKASEHTFAGKKVVKISGNIYSDVTKLATALHKKKINTFEADLNPASRFLIDNDLYGPLEIEGEYDSSAEKVDRVYTKAILKPSQISDKIRKSLKVVALDIESSKTTGDLLCVGFYGEKYKKNFLISDKKGSIPNTIKCSDEAELLEKCRQEIIEQDPDVLTGWHVIDFDLAYLKSRFTKNKVPFDLGRTNQNARIRLQNGFFKDSTAEIPGRQVLDGLNLIRDPFIKEAPTIKNAKFESYTLESVSQELLGEGKLLKGKGRHEEIEQLYEQDQKKLVEYNIKDCKLAYDILEKTQITDLAIERATLTGMPLNKITSSIAAFDSLYIREARKRGLVSPTTKYEKRGERITGGYVMDSEPGIYHNVLVLDFKSLYPSIIKTFNIDPASHLEKKQKNVVESPNKTYFKNTEGVLPQIIETLHLAREKAKKEKRELASYAIKIIMNSFFGVLASPNCRYYSLDMANAITHFARYIIKLTAEKINESGYKVTYSDTDSVFVETGESKTKAAKIGKNIEKEINLFFEKHTKKEYNRRSYLELELEKLYLAFMMPPVRHSTAGSKKRYAGLLEKNGKEQIEVVGLEAIRGDWTEAAQEFQLQLLDKIFHKEEFVAFIREYVKSIRDGKLDKKLIYRKSLRKPLEEYTKTTPPHVKAARKLDNLTSNIVEYYITENGPEPIQKQTSKLDYDHYIKKQIEPIANTILFFFDKDFEELTQTTKQMKLF